MIKEKSLNYNVETKKAIKYEKKVTGEKKEGN